ncbi:inducible nitrate reductase 2 [Colletotrichum cereale]|nr:inducible nitrate reductase 2 [Colletotrichum cereale]
MKRILALHGVGSSASILKEQLTPLQRELGSWFEFVYLNGAIERERGPGMAASYPGPFYCYTAGYAPADIRDTFDDLDDFIQENGPFDGVFGFSQGASIAASYILDYQLHNPEGPPPFDFAVLFSSVAAFSAETGYCAGPVAELVANSAVTRDFPAGDFSKLQGPKARLLVEYLALSYGVARTIGAVTSDDDLAFLAGGGTPDQIPRPLHPALTPFRVRIPTVHITGKADLPDMIAQSRRMRELCDQTLVRVHEHSGGHSIPGRRQDVKVIAESIEWAMNEGCYRRAVHRAMGKI